MFTADQFVAHRGYQKHFPENSLLAVQEAIKAGARHVEVDILLSEDNTFILCHDPDLPRINGGNGLITQMPAAEICQLTANEPERLAGKFADVHFSPLTDLLPIIQANPEVHFYIELKEEAIESHSLALCLQTLYPLLAPVFAQITVISFDAAAIKAAKTTFSFPRAGVVLVDWPSRNQVIADTRSDIVFINKKLIPAGPISIDCPLVVYEIAEPALAQDLLNRGASRIETFAIGEMLAALA